MSENYTLPDEFGGLILPTVEKIVKLGKKRGLSDEEISTAKSLSYFLDLREMALSIKPYKEHPFGEIAAVSYQLLEEPFLDETNPYTGLSLEEKAEKMVQRNADHYQATKKKEGDAKRHLQIALDTITLKGLEYLNSFHYLLDGIEFVSEDFVETFPNLGRIFSMEHKRLKEKHGDIVQDYHIIPEIIDWNFYLTIRGEEPDDLESEDYDKVLEQIFLLAKIQDADKKARKYLDGHPNAAEEILKGNPPVEDPSLPRTPLEVRTISREAHRRLYGKRKSPDIELDEEEINVQV